jgi:hypothetical protein
MAAVIDEARRRQRRRRIAAAVAIAIACAASGIALALAATGGGGKSAAGRTPPQTIQVKRADGTRVEVVLPFRDIRNCPARPISRDLSGAKLRAWFMDSSRRATQIWMTASPACGR